MLQTPADFEPVLTALAHPAPESFVFHEGKLLLRESDLALPGPELTAALALPQDRLLPVGLLYGKRYYQTSWLDGVFTPPVGYAFYGLRSLFAELEADLLGVAGRAFQIAEWARTHRFCGACASPMALVAGERCMRCPQCGHSAYPRISPAMMVLIRKGDQVLLARHTHAAVQRYTPLAGFLEAGESVEEAVHREVMEEVGLRVHNLQYFKSQSWPFPHSLMLAFTADYLDGEIRTDPNEIADARWFGPDDEWPPRIPNISVSTLLVDAHRPPGK
ncbi:NAD(+) diphosphatase [Massilia sp. TS11]|uniref:NAD(+) diphosphatase n=1 Tax=Massilia sp. TS11 TaxID=2908003 RepID=UPI001EDB70D6|nr:NAD(+) diphosphatase [Massilia sp. TS11]MCG2586634.1 NAD(+) diphosphatase [Massilia sp. TS11]